MSSDAANGSALPPLLAGTTVLDFTQYLAGPTATRLMAELGETDRAWDLLWQADAERVGFSLITGFPGSFITAFFTGSLLIETIFSLDGLGLLGYNSVLNRDYPVVLGTLYFFTIIGLVARLLSDLSYVWVDPRISFERLQ